MDMKRYAGKKVWVQFEAPWIAVQVSAESDVVLSARKNPQTGEPEPCPMPFIIGEMSEDGVELLVKDSTGGVLALQLSERVVHSVAVAVEAPPMVQPAAPGSLITPNSPLPS